MARHHQHFAVQPRGIAQAGESHCDVLGPKRRSSLQVIRARGGSGVAALVALAVGADIRRSPLTVGNALTLRATQKWSGAG